MVENLSNSEIYEQIKHRINLLSVSHRPLWGKMNVSQMLSHCAIALEVTVGLATLKVSFMGKLIGPFILKKLLTEKPFKKNSPTAKEYVIVDEKI